MTVSAGAAAGYVMPRSWPNGIRVLLLAAGMPILYYIAGPTAATFALLTGLFELRQRRNRTLVAIALAAALASPLVVGLWMLDVPAADAFTYLLPSHENTMPVGLMPLSLLFALPLVRILINSGAELNTTGLASMPLTLAEGAAAVAGPAWPVLAPWIGALGAFVAGSNTVSNLTFALFQFATAENIGATPETVVAAQAVGGAAGNMITVHNVVAASATVGLLGREGDVIRMTIIPMTYYCLLSGGLAFVLIHGVGLNTGTVLLTLVLLTLAAIVVGLRRAATRLPA